MEEKTVITEHHVDDASSLVSAWVTKDDVGHYYTMSPKGSGSVRFMFHRGPVAAGRLHGVTVPALLAVALTEIRWSETNDFAGQKLLEVIALFKEGPADTMSHGEIIEAAKRLRHATQETLADDAASILAKPKKKSRRKTLELKSDD